MCVFYLDLNFNGWIMRHEEILLSFTWMRKLGKCAMRQAKCIVWNVACYEIYIVRSYETALHFVCLCVSSPVNLREETPMYVWDLALWFWLVLLITIVLMRQVREKCTIHWKHNWYGCCVVLEILFRCYRLNHQDCIFIEKDKYRLRILVIKSSIIIMVMWLSNG